MTLWRPIDTCGCQIEIYEHPDIPDKFMHRETIVACPKHAQYAHTQAHVDAVLVHNRLKNSVKAWVEERLGREVHGTYDRNAPIDNDPIIVYGHGLSASDRDAFQMLVDTQFGAGNVIIREST